MWKVHGSLPGHRILKAKGIQMRMWDVYLPMGNLEGGMDLGAKSLEPLSPKLLPPLILLLFLENLPLLESWPFVPGQGIEAQTSRQ